MKFLVANFFLLASISCSLIGGDKVNSQPAIQHNRNKNISPQNGTTMKITVGAAVFKATLYDNATASAFKSLLTLTVNMNELNGNEKYVDLPRNLPMNSANPGTIQNGDLMLYGSATLVLFYKTFSTSFSYSKLGRIADVTGLVAALGTGKVMGLFESE